MTREEAEALMPNQLLITRWEPPAVVKFLKLSGEYALVQYTHDYKDFRKGSGAKILFSSLDIYVERLHGSTNVAYEKQTVLLEYPEAVAWMNADNGRYKVFYPISKHEDGRKTWVALSASWDNEGAAWIEAAKAIREKKGA